jgi:threonine dehydrogenase-like Zn-dependent dehydrogenase
VRLKYWSEYQPERIRSRGSRNTCGSSRVRRLAAWVTPATLNQRDTCGLRAITLIPGRQGSAELTELPDPEPAPGELLVEPLVLGVCGTDREILAGTHGSPPEGHERLVLGHELLARVVSAPEDSGFEPGAPVAAIVRRPDPVPCECCARGEWDMCRNGLYTERGIKGRDGYGAELVTLEAEFAVRVAPELGHLGVLTEPASVLAKAWDHIERIRARACSGGDRVLVTGAGPIGLLAALMGTQRGHDVHVLELATGGVKPGLVRDLGAEYHTGAITEVSRDLSADIVIECTGVGELVIGAMRHTAPGAVVCLTGVGGQRTLDVEVGAVNAELVLENDVVFGSVNANRRHFEHAAEALRRADPAWLGRLITRRVPLERWQDALEKEEDDIKVVVDFPATQSGPAR